MGYDPNDRNYIFSMKKFIKQNKYLEAFVRKVYSFIPYRKRNLDEYFYEFTDLLNQNEKKSANEINEYQFRKLKHIVNIAYHHTDFYKKKYDEVGFNPEMLTSLDSLEKIPLLTKDEVKIYCQEMVDNRINKKLLYKGYTSGTTGKALELYFDKRTMSREWASICYQWARVGYRPGDGRIELRGFIQDDRDFIYFPDEKVLRINIIKMNSFNINEIINKIHQVNYKFIHGYPSAIYKFAKIVESKDIKYAPNAILMASEILYDWQIEVIDKVFDCAKIIHYGQAEKVALGAWTDERKYSFIPTYGILEFDNNTNELIATGFINEAMPLIRYRLTDTVEEFLDKSLSNEQALFPKVSNIGGREEDYTYDENNNLIPPAVVTFPFKQLKYIDAAKIIQNNINNFELLLETTLHKNDINLKNEVKSMIIDFQKLYGRKAKFIITFTDHIPLGSNGKFRWIECKIK